MGAEPSAFGAFYRRFEDEVLRYFLARGAKPEVAADLTAETFAAALPSRRWKRLAVEAQRTLQSSRRDGRVVAEARQRKRMRPLVLTDESAARIAAMDRSSSMLATDFSFEEQDDVRVRVIDETDLDHAATCLRTSDALTRRHGHEANADRADVPRIPELEEQLESAAARAATRRRGAVVTAAAALGVTVLAFVVLAGGDDDQPLSSSTATATPASVAERPRSAVEEEVRLTANNWARRFGAARPGACVEPMNQPACERLICDSVRGPVRNCVPLPLRAQRSFRDARVDTVVIEGRQAAVRFTNGQAVDFVDAGPRDGYWMVDEVGRRAGRGIYGRERSQEEKVVLAGNAWARFFAAGDKTCLGMTQPGCQRVSCEGPGGPIEDCVPLPPEFRRSFRDATIEGVPVIRDDRAVARFSNGETVEFFYARDGGGSWLVHKLGPTGSRDVVPE